MTPKVRITKEMIVEAALELVKENGIESVNARTVSERLHCSTQPIMYNFKTIENFRQAESEKEYVRINECRRVKFNNRCSAA